MSDEDNKNNDINGRDNPSLQQRAVPFGYIGNNINNEVVDNNNNNNYNTNDNNPTTVHEENNNIPVDEEAGNNVQEEKKPEIIEMTIAQYLLIRLCTKTPMLR